ncbi:hypothetical protein [Methylorubrum extorquens]|uniref:hypothetical protein n=1 Tax=Methylorubrum extorquens TaxID=408 RepID=UPI001EE56AC9|nr:hypothetical protein [Methylorubrum extorquens]MCG5244844.1 hypothetical protein [Methylorubrum extorquens]
MRTVRLALMLVIAAMALAAQKVWDGTKWVARAFSGMPTPPSTGIEDALDDLADAARPVTPSQPARDTISAYAPAPEVAPKSAPVTASAQVVELDPILAKGKAAHAFACALATLDEVPSTDGLDEAETAWLNSLNASEMMMVYRAGPMRTGAHMAGIEPLRSLPLCPTLAEYRHILGQAARISPRQRAEIQEYNETLDAAFQEMIEDPGFELKRGV